MIEELTENEMNWLNILCLKKAGGQYANSMAFQTAMMGNIVSQELSRLESLGFVDIEYPTEKKGFSALLTLTEKGLEYAELLRTFKKL